MDLPLRKDIRLKTLKTIEPEWETELEETLVNPLLLLGFELKSYSNQFQPNGLAGVHTFIFEHDDQTVFKSSDIENLMTEAENRPTSVFQRSLDILWVFLPYTI